MSAELATSQPPDTSATNSGLSRTTSVREDVFGRVREEDDDVLTQLRNVGKRTRASVNEGYKNDYFPPVQPASHLQRPPRTFFRTQSEMRHDMFVKSDSAKVPPAFSTRQRESTETSDPSNADSKSVNEEQEGGEGDTLAPLPDRTLSPPRQRPLGPSITLPSGSSSIFFSDKANEQAQPAEEEEDWSEAAFGGDTGFKRL